MILQIFSFCGIKAVESYKLTNVLILASSEFCL